MGLNDNSIGDLPEKDVFISVKEWMADKGDAIYIPIRGFTCHLQHSETGREFQSFLAFHFYREPVISPGIYPIGMTFDCNILFSVDHLPESEQHSEIQKPVVVPQIDFPFRTILTRARALPDGRNIPIFSCFIDQANLTFEEGAAVLHYTTEQWNQHWQRVKVCAEQLAGKDSALTGYSADLIPRLAAKIYPKLHEGLKAGLTGTDLVDRYLVDHAFRVGAIPTGEAVARFQTSGNPAFEMLLNHKSGAKNNNAVVCLFLVLNWFMLKVYELSDNEVAELVHNHLGIEIKGRSVAKRLDSLGLSFDRHPGPPERDSG